MFDEARGLWRGPALLEFRGWAWAEGSAARLDALRLGVIEDHIAVELALGRSAEVVAELEALVVEHPLREGLWSHLILGLYRSGRQAEALRAFAALRERLADELGIVPSPALQLLERDVLMHAPGLQLEPPAPAFGNAHVPGHHVARDARDRGPELGSVLCCRFGGLSAAISGWAWPLPDPPTGAGTSIELTTAVTNTGPDRLRDISVIDNELGTIACPPWTLEPGESTVCGPHTVGSA